MSNTKTAIEFLTSRAVPVVYVDAPGPFDYVKNIPDAILKHAQCKNGTACDTRHGCRIHAAQVVTGTHRNNKKVGKRNGRSNSQD